MTAASRYANALFSLAQEGKTQAAVTAAVAALQAAVEDASVLATLSDARLSPAKRTQFAGAMAMAIKAPMQLANTLSLMATNNRLALVPAMLVAYQEAADKASGITHVKVATATALTDAQRTKISSMLKAHTKATDIRLEETLDTHLQGGFRAFYNGMVWDASLSGAMSRLSTRLRAAITQR